MSAAVTAPGRARAQGSQTRRAASWLLWSHLFMAAWFWGIVVVLSLVVNLVFSGGLGVQDDGSVTSITSFGTQAATWFTFAMAIALSTRQLAPHLAAGLTRRSFVRANLVVCAAMAGVYAGVLVLLLVVERLVVRAAGGEPRLVDGVPFDDAADAGRVLVLYLLVFCAAAAAGLVVGMAYQRLGGLWGTVTLLPTVPPLILVMWLLVDRSSSEWIPSALDADAARVLLCAAIAACYALVYRAMMRRVTV